MRRKTREQIETEAVKITELWLCLYGLRNAYKISKIVRKRLKAIKSRRKKQEAAEV
jgi:hypothetical protein